MTKKIRASEKKEMSFLDHLEELRWHLIRASLAIATVSVVAFIYKRIVFDLIIFGPRNPDFLTYRFFCWFSGKFGGSLFCFDEMPFELLNTRMAGQFTTHLWVSIVAGVIVAFPYIMYEFWRFISPGLHETERKSSKGIIFISSLLFLSGVAFGYFVISPFSVQFLATYTVSSDVVNRIDLSSFISTITSVTLASGIVFELPVIVFFLSRAGLLTPDIMKTYRKHALVIILVLSAIITPPDLTSQVLVTLPVLLLYEVSIKVSARVEKRRLKNLAI
jgi:sec-independent protein translocase protein TatC